MATSSLVRILVLDVIFAVTCGFGSDNVQSLPKDFLLGVSSSAYQIEGAWNESGKSVNIWDWFTHEYPDVIRDHTNGDVACDSYHKYKEDVQLLNDIGVDFYRFSLSWSRILPNGYADVINYDGLKFYKDVIDELLANGIEPFVTLYHWDHPRVFEHMGGWMNESMIDWISDYARIVFRELGPKVKYFMSINEPIVLCDEGYATGMMAPGKQLGYAGLYQCLHNTLKAHARIYHIYKEEFKEQNGQIGTAIPCFGLFPKTPNDIQAVDTYFQFNCALMAAPIFSKTGDYPEIVKKHVAENSKLDGLPKSILPEFTSEWVQYIKNTADFLGLNHYTSRLVEIVSRKEGEKWYDYSGVKASFDPSWPSTGSDWLKVIPSGLQQLLNQITTEYDHPPIIILENGVSDKSGTTNDTERISYLHSYMNAMLTAIYEDGCNVKGYTIWSLLDNFEWGSGYLEKFGIIQVNFTDPNRTRTPKSSMYWYKNVIQTRELSCTLTSTDLNPSVLQV